MVQERLELWKEPYLVNVLLVNDISSPDAICKQKEIIFDYSSPLNHIHYHKYNFHNV